MTFRFIDQVIGDMLINLEALTPDSNLYTTLLLQHEGTFAASAQKFGNHTDCTPYFIKFLELAKSSNASIAITPEYSCTWEAVKWIFDNAQNQPAQSKLWVLGCESITPAELRKLREDLQSDNVLIVFDDTVLENAVNSLLDPLCYIFNVQDSVTNNSKIVLLVQFKTEHMGVWSNDIERELYIPGKEVYVLRNSPGSISLFTLICSETESFTISEAFNQSLDHRWEHNPFLVINIQMNPQPSALFFRNFRNSILNFDLKDIITLNWSSDSTKQNGQPLIPYSKSSISFRSNDMSLTNEAVFIANHNMGLYYTIRRPRLHTYFMNGNKNVFLISNQKPISGGVDPSLLKRSGPRVRNNYTYIPGSNSFEDAPPMDDRFLHFLDSHGCTNAVLRSNVISFIDKERLISLSIGKIKVSTTRTWQTIENLHTFLLNDDETIQRFTFTQDIAGDQFRRAYLEQIDIINSVILINPDYFTPNHTMFPGNCRELMFPGVDIDDYKFNLVTNDGKHKATVAFIGRTTLEEAHDTLKNIWKLFAEGDNSKKRVIVWYKPNVNTISAVFDDKKPSVASDTKSASNSISKQP